MCHHAKTIKRDGSKREKEKPKQDKIETMNKMAIVNSFLSEIKLSAH